jgi:hypothetical protein
MDKFLRPDRFDADPSSPESSKQWLHWYRTFQSFLTSIASHTPNQLDVLINYIAPSVYSYIADCTTNNEAIKILETAYVKPKNEIFARHLLATRRQEFGESLDQFLQSLKQLSKDCNFKAATAEEYRDSSIRDSFISGLQSNHIRQRLLENKCLDLATAFDQARALEMAQQHSNSYSRADTTTVAALQTNDAPPTALAEDAPERGNLNTASSACYFCGRSRHPRSKCPAKDATCNKCSKTGHFSKVCRSTKMVTAAANHTPTLATISAASPTSLAKAIPESL